MIDIDSVVYGRRLMHQIQKQSHDGVFVDTPIGRYRLYYAEFVGESMQIKTTYKPTFLLQPDEWTNAFCDRWGKNLRRLPLPAKENRNEQS